MKMDRVPQDATASSRSGARHGRACQLIKLAWRVQGRKLHCACGVKYRGTYHPCFRKRIPHSHSAMWMAEGTVEGGELRLVKER